MREEIADPEIKSRYKKSERNYQLLSLLIIITVVVVIVIVIPITVKRLKKRERERESKSAAFYPVDPRVILRSGIDERRGGGVVK